MSVHVLRTIPLSLESRKGWQDAGATLIRRHITVSDSKLRKYFSTQVNSGTVVNLGRSDNHLDTFTDALVGVLYNHPSSIRAIKTPAAIRKTLPEFLPPQKDNSEPLAEGPYWVKGPGQGGNEKHFYKEGPIFGNLPYKPGFDTQIHIEGTEYRIITVGNKVVQAHKKEKNGHNFDYTWVGVSGINGLGIIPFIHEAVKKVPLGDRTVIGWDVIHDGTRPYIIEANSSPGVNTATAQRIIKELVNA